jgi:hypothetical protein
MVYCRCMCEGVACCVVGEFPLCRRGSKYRYKGILNGEIPITINDSLLLRKLPLRKFFGKVRLIVLTRFRERAMGDTPLPDNRKGGP